MTESISHPGIYKVVCTANNRSYVGQADNIQRRWNRHAIELSKGIHNNKPMQRAWNKYGAGAFTIMVAVDLRHLSGDELQAALNEHEKRIGDATRKKFNVAKIGTRVHRITDASRAKMGAAAAARWADPEFRARTIANMRAKATDPEFQARRGAAISKTLQTPEGRAKRSAQTAAAWANEEAKKARGAAISAGHAARRAAKAPPS